MMPTVAQAAKTIAIEKYELRLSSGESGFSDASKCSSRSKLEECRILLLVYIVCTVSIYLPSPDPKSSGFPSKPDLVGRVDCPRMVDTHTKFHQNS